MSAQALSGQDQIAARQQRLGLAGFQPRPIGVARLGRDGLLRDQRFVQRRHPVQQGHQIGAHWFGRDHGHAHRQGGQDHLGALGPAAPDPQTIDRCRSVMPPGHGAQPGPRRALYPEGVPHRAGFGRLRQILQRGGLKGQTGGEGQQQRRLDHLDHRARHIQWVARHPVGKGPHLGQIAFGVAQTGLRVAGAPGGQSLMQRAQGGTQQIVVHHPVQRPHRQKLRGGFGPCAQHQPDRLGRADQPGQPLADPRPRQQPEPRFGQNDLHPLRGKAVMRRQRQRPDRAAHGGFKTGNDRLGQRLDLRADQRHGPGHRGVQGLAALQGQDHAPHAAVPRHKRQRLRQRRQITVTKRRARLGPGLRERQDQHIALPVLLQPVCPSHLSHHAPDPPASPCRISPQFWELGKVPRKTDNRASANPDPRRTMAVSLARETPGWVWGRAPSIRQDGPRRQIRPSPPRMTHRHKSPRTTGAALKPVTAVITFTP